MKMRCKIDETDEGLTVALQILSEKESAYNPNSPTEEGKRMPIWSYALLTEAKNGPWANAKELGAQVMAAGGAIAEHQAEHYGDTHDPSKAANLGLSCFQSAIKLYQDKKIKDHWVGAELV
jgi:hypothetical protein